MESYDLIGGARVRRLHFDTCLEVGRVHTLPAFSVFWSQETRRSLAVAISKLTIMKFGGTSVEDAPAFERLVNIVGTVHTLKTSCPVVVVSAMSGVTNALLASVGQATAGDPEGAMHSLEPQWERHLTVAQALTRESAAIEVMLQTAKREIADLLRATAAETMPRPLLQDLIVSYGERLSAALLAAVLRQASLPAQHVDARRCIITNGEHGRAEPLPAADHTTNASRARAAHRC